MPVSIYLVNGIKLQGQIESFDQYVVLLKNTVTQMVYKHAISTVVPARAGPMPHHAPSRRAGRLSSTRAPGRAHRHRRGALGPMEPRCRCPCARPDAACLSVRRAAIARCWSLSISATAIRPSGSPRSTRSPCPRARRSSARSRSPPASRRRALRRQGQGRGDRRAAHRNRRRRSSMFDHELSGASSATSSKTLECRVVDRSEPDPRHLRAARAQRRRQAAGRAGAARVPAPAPRPRLDPPRAAEGRHRPARPRRNAARNRPPAARQARQGAEGPARAGRTAARDAGPHARRASCAPCRWSATPTPARPRCSTG